MHHPEGGPTPSKSPRETLYAIELVIEPSELQEQSIGGQTIFRHRQKTFLRVSYLKLCRDRRV